MAVTARAKLSYIFVLGAGIKEAKFMTEENVRTSVSTMTLKAQGATILQQGGAAAPPIPGPLDGIGLPKPKEVQDFLEELFGGGQPPNGPQDPKNQKDGKGGKSGDGQRRKGPSVDDLYPKGSITIRDEPLPMALQNQLFINGDKSLVVKSNNVLLTTPLIHQVSKQMRDFKNCMFRVNQLSNDQAMSIQSNYYDLKFAAGGAF